MFRLKCEGRGGRRSKQKNGRPNGPGRRAKPAFLLGRVFFPGLDGHKRGLPKGPSLQLAKTKMIPGGPQQKGAAKTKGPQFFWGPTLEGRESDSSLFPKESISRPGCDQARSDVGSHINLVVGISKKLARWPIIVKFHRWGRTGLLSVWTLCPLARARAKNSQNKPRKGR